MYVIEFSPDAQKDLLLLQKKSPTSLRKLGQFLNELREHPRSGTGKVERLKGYANETWSRRLSKEHRLVYEIHDDVILVLVLSTFGHYE